jgi:hypothetical protein
MITRGLDEARLRSALAEAPVVLLTGPRQAGKSTLARTVVDPDPARWFDLEDPRDLARLAEPTAALEALTGTVVIDEAQRRPDLFPELRVLVDRDRRPGRFLLVGSASPELVGLSSESLAGRIRMVALPGLRVADVPGELEQLWLRGGLPPAFLADDDARSNRWRDDYVSTFLERDLAQLGVRVPATTMRRFWTMVAHFHGQAWNGAELARALGVSQTTVRRYLDALTDALVVRQLQPWFENLAKRQVRSPKVYLRDSGLLHRLLGIDDRVALDRHPKHGASWEGFVIEQLVTLVEPRSVSFWGTQRGAELDLRLEHGGATIGVEVKRTDRPRVTPSMRIALDDLRLDHLAVVCSVAQTFALADRMSAVPAELALTSGIESLLG